MDTIERTRFIREKLRFRRSLLGDEFGDREVRAAILRGEVVRVIRGCYMSASDWAELQAEDRLLAQTLSVGHLQSEHQPLFSHLSAAVLWGMPVYGLKGEMAERVHTLTRPSAPGRSSATVLRHVGEYSEEEVSVIAGMRVTSLSRTILDLARWAPATTAIGCADAGLRLLFGARRDECLDDVEAWKDEQFGVLGAMRRRPGVAAARELLRIADPRADSVAESVSRLQLVRLKVPHAIQVHVAGLRRDYWLDFEFSGQRTFGEMDGKAKYTDPEYMSGRTIEEILLDEREREVEIKGITRNDIVRWGWDDIPTARRFGLRLLRFGLDVPGLR